MDYSTKCKALHYACAEEKSLIKECAETLRKKKPLFKDHQRSGKLGGADTICLTRRNLFQAMARRLVYKYRITKLWWEKNQPDAKDIGAPKWDTWTKGIIFRALQADFKLGGMVDHLSDFGKSLSAELVAELFAIVAPAPKPAPDLGPTHEIIRNGTEELVKVTVSLGHPGK